MSRDLFFSDHIFFLLKQNLSFTMGCTSSAYIPQLHKNPVENSMLTNGDQIEGFATWNATFYQAKNGKFIAETIGIYEPLILLSSDVRAVNSKPFIDEIYLFVEWRKKRGWIVFGRTSFEMLYDNKKSTLAASEEWKMISSDAKEKLPSNIITSVRYTNVFAISNTPDFTASTFRIGKEAELLSSKVYAYSFLLVKDPVSGRRGFVTIDQTNVGVFVKHNEIHLPGAPKLFALSEDSVVKTIGGGLSKKFINQWTSEDVMKWLKENQLSDLQTALTGFDGKMLAACNDQDLRDLNVGLLERKKFLGLLTEENQRMITAAGTSVRTVEDSKKEDVFVSSFKKGAGQTTGKFVASQVLNAVF
jgi:hypothetical protein